MGHVSDDEDYTLAVIDEFEDALKVKRTRNTRASEKNRESVRLCAADTTWLHKELAASVSNVANLPSPVTPRVDSMVVSAHLDVLFNLQELCFSLRNAEYDPRKVNGLIMRLFNPRVTVTIFRQGRITVTGAKHPDEAYIACRKTTRLLQMVGYESATLTDFSVQSMVISADLRFPIRLEALARDRANFCTYEPEVNAGLVYRHSRAVLLIFVTGKMLISGNKDLSDIAEIFHELYPMFCSYRL